MDDDHVSAVDLAAPGQLKDIFEHSDEIIVGDPSASQVHGTVEQVAV
jgi:hypothetical protein